MRVGLVTCQTLPEPDPDHGPLTQALVRSGHEPILIAWDQEGNAAETCDLLVMRSAWNYHEAPKAFLAWCRSAAARVTLLNPLPVIEWNHHKGYLSDLAAAGVPIVPTEFVCHASRCDVTALATRRGWNHLVIKPSISCGSFETRAFRREVFEAAQHFADRLAGQRDIMIQPFMSGFDEPGERSVIWIDGECTHAVRKQPRLAGDEECVLAEAALGLEEQALAEAAIAAVRGPLAYARVDMVRSDGNGWQVSELELIEPSLFFDHAPEALDRFVRCLERRVNDAE